MNDLRMKQRQFSRVDNLMWRVTKQLTKKKKMILDEFELTCSQYDILTAIDYFSNNKSEVIQVNLSERAQIDPMTTSTVLRNLQKRNLIKRERGLINTRTVEVSLTQKGRELYNEAQQKIEKMRADIYQNLDQQQLTSQLLILSDKLNK
ncbi:MAG TPA: MarR family transcriptional regulator [Dysgonomonas sp.]|nr:MarR family transcriptional regulator [Dysgonomonas sp.]